MMSVRRLLKVADVRFRVLRRAVLPAGFALLSAILTRILLVGAALSGIPLVLLEAAVCGVFYLAMLTLFEVGCEKLGKTKNPAASEETAG